MVIFSYTIRRHLLKNLAYTSGIYCHRPARNCEDLYIYRDLFNGRYRAELENGNTYFIFSDKVQQYIQDLYRDRDTPYAATMIL